MFWLHVYNIVRSIVTLYIKIIYRPMIIGTDNINKEGPVILAGNHTNQLDSLFLISSTKRSISFLGKHTLLKGFKKYFFKSMGVIPVNRAIKDKSVIPISVDALKNNGVLGIFPEGTINRTNDIIMPFKIGAIKIAQLTGVPIVPFVINGKYKFLGNKLRIEFLKPIKVKSGNLEKENEGLMKIIEEELRKTKVK